MKTFNVVWYKRWKDRQGEEHKRALTLGVAFFHETKNQINLELDLVPAGWDGRAFLFPKEDRPGGGRERAPEEQGGMPSEDEIPF